MRRSFWAPGRINLIGEHTDYTGGLVLPTAIDRGVTVEGEASSGAIRMVSDSFPGEVVVDPVGRGQVSGWGRFVAAVAQELDALGRPAVGFSGRVSSTLPAGAGLSSSAALEVALGVALCAVAEFEIDRLELARAAQRAELRAVGVPCGILDQMASLFGQARQALFIDTATLECRPVPLPETMSLVVLDSGVRRRLEDGRYAQRRVELERGIAAQGEAIRELSSSDLPFLESRLDPVALRRLRHVITENERVQAVVALLEQGGDAAVGLGDIFRSGHESLRDDFEVSTRELDLLVDLAFEHAEVIAARLTGGGFGGSVIALAESREASPTAQEIVTEYRARTGIIDAQAFVCSPSSGAREL